MSIFTNKSTVELIPQSEVNSDFGVLRFRSASFNNFDIKKYQNADGTPNELAVNKIYECLKNKHRSVFFGSNLIFEMPCEIDCNDLSNDEIAGIKRKGYTTKLTIFLAMRWLYYKPTYIEKYILTEIENEMKVQYPACYEALQRLIIEKPRQKMTAKIDKEEELLNDARFKFLSFKAQIPIFIARQLYRHRGINFTERSGRYTAENTMFYEPDAWRKAPEKATQGSVENEFVEEKEIQRLFEKDIKVNNRDYIYESHLKFNYKDLTEGGNIWYEKNLENGMCKEQARMILPQSQITTTINTVDLYTLSNILSQRLDKHAQKEIRDFAKDLYDIACKEFDKELIDKLIDIQNRLTF